MVNSKVSDHTPLSKNLEYILLASILLISLLLRFASLDYLDAADNYNNLAYKNLYENGVSYNKYSTISTHFTMLFINMFGFNSFSLRLPSLIYSFITTILIYLTARRIHVAAALISIFLFAISPWSIIMSRLTRDYAFDCMISSFVIFFTILLISEIHKKTPSQIIKSCMWLAVIIFSVFLLTKFNNSSQTLIVSIFPLIGILFCIFYLLRMLIKSRNLLITIFATFALVSFLFFYHFDYQYFEKGWWLNLFYLKIFFAPGLESPWQWFHGNHVKYISKLYFLFFFIPLFYAYRNKESKYLYFTILYSAFFIGIGIFVLKFKTHILYDPTRYVYFLFPLYTIIYAYAFYYFSTLITKNKRYQKIIFCIALALFINTKSLWYAVYPIKAWENEHMSTLPIDNLGVGHFNMYDVAKFIKEDLGWDGNKIFCFDGRYGEFILLLDCKMDPDRYFSKDYKYGKRYHFDLGKNAYLESSFHRVHELKTAVSNHKTGYFVTRRSFITDEEENPIANLQEKTFSLFNSRFLFIKNINGYKIYLWEPISMVS